MERAAEAAALAAAACAKIENPEEDEDDPLEKYMEDIAKEVKSFRGNNATIISSKANGTNAKIIKQEPGIKTVRNRLKKEEDLEFF